MKSKIKSSIFFLFIKPKRKNLEILKFNYFHPFDSLSVDWYFWFFLLYSITLDKSNGIFIFLFILSGKKMNRRFQDNTLSLFHVSCR